MAGTEPRADDPAALVERSRAQAKQIEAAWLALLTRFDQPDWLGAAHSKVEDLLVLIARLADTLEYWHAYAVEWRDEYRLAMAADIDAARADLAALQDGYRRAVAQEKLWQDEAAALRQALVAEEQLCIKDWQWRWECYRCGAMGDMPTKAYTHKPGCNFAALTPPEEPDRG